MRLKLFLILHLHARFLQTIIAFWWKSYHFSCLINYSQPLTSNDESLKFKIFFRNTLLKCFYRFKTILLKFRRNRKLFYRGKSKTVCINHTLHFFVISSSLFRVNWQWISLVYLYKIHVCMSISSPNFYLKKVLCKNDLYVAINVKGKE